MWVMSADEFLKLLGMVFLLLLRPVYRISERFRKGVYMLFFFKVYFIY